MENKNAQNCWEYWDCKIKQDCPAHQNNSGRECFEIASHNCPRINQGKPGVPKVDRGFNFCWECPWFKIVNPDFEK